MPIVTLANGTRFEAGSGTPMLDAALAQGVVLEHSCRTGRCGTCKARLVSGTAAALRPPVSLTDAEIAQGWVLTCAHEATSDAGLDIEDLGLLAGISARVVPARIDALERVAPDVMRVHLRLPPRSELRFLAGQYVDVTSPAGIHRSYSIASDPAAPGRIELQVRRVDAGHLSAYWFERAQPNDLLRFNGPRGTFFLRPVAGLDLVFLATGTGVAPICAMLRQVAAMAPQERPHSVSLYWGGRQRADLYLDPHEHLPALRYVPVLSREDAGWGGARGHVQDVLLHDVAQGRLRGLAHCAVYACGSDLMIHGASRALADAGLPPRRFFSDAFVSSD